jgi:hypothetical protein
MCGRVSTSELVADYNIHEQEADYNITFGQNSIFRIQIKILAFGQKLHLKTMIPFNPPSCQQCPH